MIGHLNLLRWATWVWLLFVVGGWFVDWPAWVRVLFAGLVFFDLLVHERLSYWQAEAIRMHEPDEGKPTVRTALPKFRADGSEHE